MNINTKWYTDGKTQVLIRNGDLPPEGFRRGRLKSSKATRDKISKSLIGNTRKLGKKESKSTRQKKSKSKIGNKNSTGQDNKWSIGTIHIHKGDVGRRIKPKDLEKYLDRDYELGESPLHVRNRLSNNAVSKPEKKIAKYLESKDLTLHTQYQIPGKPHHYDFYLEDYNLLIEFDGTYWHRNQDLF